MKNEDGYTNTLIFFCGCGGGSLLRAVVEYFLDNVFDGRIEEVLSIRGPPIDEGGSIESLRDVRLKLKFLAPFLKFLLGLPTFSFRRTKKASSVQERTKS